MQPPLSPSHSAASRRPGARDVAQRLLEPGGGAQSVAQQLSISWGGGGGLTPPTPRTPPPPLK